MAIQSIGSDNGLPPKPVTLRQYIQKTNGKAPKVSAVTVMFFPGKVPNYTLVQSMIFVSTSIRILAYFTSSMSRLLNGLTRVLLCLYSRTLRVLENLRFVSMMRSLANTDGS